MTRTETSREERMVVIERDADGKPTIWCDPEIADLVTALNAGGVPTVASCSGHGHRPGSIALKDGRWLVVATDDAEHDAIEAIFLTDINGDPITPKHPLSDDGLRAIAGKQFGINDPDLCAQLATELLASRTQSPAEWQVGAAQRAYDAAMAEWKHHPEAPIASMPNPMYAALRAASIPAPERSKEETGVTPDPTYRSPREDASYFGSIWSLSTNQMAELEKTFEYHRDHHPSFGTDYPEGAPSSERASCTDPLADREKSAALETPAKPTGEE